MIALLPVILANWKWVVAGGFALLFGLLVISWEVRGRAVAELTMQVSTLQANLKTAQDLAQLTQDGNTSLLNRMQQQQDAATRTTHLLDEVTHARPIDDGAVAPVLRNALSGLPARRVR